MIDNYSYYDLTFIMTVINEMHDLPANINDYNIVFYDSWHSYEEYGSMLVLEKDWTYYYGYDSYSVMCDNEPFSWNDMSSCTQSRVLEKIVEYANDLKEWERNQ